MKFLYKRILKPLLFKMDPEYVHDLFVRFGEIMGNWKIGRWFICLLYKYKGADISKTVDGINYSSPIILAAGFDYNGRLAHVLDCLSFGGDEIGSITARPCKGNPKPRLKRMVKSKALVVYKGLKNKGVEEIIRHLKRKKKPKDFVWGISIAKTNDQQAATLQGGIEDYCESLRRLSEEKLGDFYTINISCPNVYGGESFTTKETLYPLMEQLSKIKHEKPMYVKMPINLEWEAFNELLIILDEFHIHGVVIGNLNKNYEDATFPEEAPEDFRGGLSGKVCKELSTQLIRKTKAHWGNRFTIIGCGGIMSVNDAREKLDAGADLLQLISGMIFEGPHLIKDICKDISRGERNNNKNLTIS